MKKLISLATLVATLAVPLASRSQTTVFNDTFSNGSTLNNGSPANPTANSTAYEEIATKSFSGQSIAANNLSFGTVSSGTTSAEIEALFATSQVTLIKAGDYVQLTVIFTNVSVLTNTVGSQFSFGMFNSGQVKPVPFGTNNATTSTTIPGYAQSWVGYGGQYFSPNSKTSVIQTRPAQAVTTGNNQDLLNNGSGSTSYTGNTAFGPGSVSTFALSSGSTYTEVLTFMLNSANTNSLAITNSLYAGPIATGTPISQYGGIATNATYLTNAFDSLAVGYRGSAQGGPFVNISKINVTKFIQTAPLISSLTNQTVVAGTSPVLSPAVTGTPAPAYQWQTNGVNIDGATSATLTLTSVQYAQDGYVYSLIATNSVGAVTNSMTLSVIVIPSISGLSDQAVSVGNTASLNPSVSGVPVPALQWRYNGVNLTDGPTVNGSTISGSAGNPLNITNAQSADSGTYSLVASNSAGMVTNSMYLTIGTGDVLPILTGPTNITVIQGNNGTFSATASGVPVPTLQWLDQTGAPITAATNNSLVLSGVLYSQNGYVYSLVASNTVGSVTNSATLTVIVPPAITGQPAGLTVTNTQAASFTVTATGVPNPTFQWYKNGSPISSGSNNSATNATLNLATTAPADSGSTYYVLIANAAGSTNSATVTLTVNSTIAAASLLPANAATGVCYDTPLYLTFSQTPTLKNAGTIKIYNVNNSATPVDTIDLSLSVTYNATYAKNIQSYLIGGDTFTNFPVIITGNQAAIYPHHGVLTSNQVYYVTLDNGTFADAAGANFAGITATNVWKFTTKVGGPANPTNLLVAADGSGDFVTVQGAVDSIASGNTTPTLITINNGNYVEVLNIKSRHNLTLRGQSRNGAVIGYANNANVQGSTHSRMAVKINANDIALDNLTVTNRTSAGGAQAEALMLESNAKRFIFNNCNLGSFQDTLLANGGGQAQAYFNNSLITGQFDYIWGGGVCFFTNCEVRTMLGTGGNWNLTASRTDNNATGTWPGYNGLASSNGFSFVSCRLTRESGSVSKISLAGSNGTTNGVSAWINCILTLAYTNGVNLAVTNSQLLWEYNNTNLVGDPVPLGLTVLTTSDARYLAASSATNWLYGWSPSLAPNILTNPVGQTVNYASPATFSVVATGIPDPTYQWQHAGTNLPSATSSTLTVASATLADGGAYAAVVTTSAGSVTSSSATLTVNPPSNTAPTFTSPISGTNITINVGVSLAVSCSATDSDSPAQTLTYALLTGPSGATLNTNSGSFTWRPTTAQSNSVNTVSVAVTDNGTPNLSATNTFTVTVNPVTAPSTASVAYSGGQFSVSISGQVGPDYYLQANTNLIGGSWTTVASTNSPATLPVILADPAAGSQPMQFYRIVVGPPAP